MIRITNIKIKEDLSEEEVFKFVISKYKISQNTIKEWNISKKSIDARKKDDIHYSYSIDINMENEDKLLKYKNISIVKNVALPTFELKLKKSYRPVIIGAGPAGLFSALSFIEQGYKPIVIEQGDKIEERKKKVDNFVNNGILNSNSNVQFGEGGAGTFSDGKLTTGISSPYCRKVLEEFVKFGATKQILYLTRPHIGTDNLIKIIKNMREYIISKGGEFLFNTKFIDFEIKNNCISKISVLHLDTNVTEDINTNVLILAIRS